ncbi:MAG: carboxymuconolactone decarboxylase family protein [Halioglobus sp.]
MTNTLKPLEAPFPPEVDRALASYPKQDGYILCLFRAFANSVRFLKKGVPNLLDRESPLDLRTREIVILRTTANRNCEYEWGVHVAIFAKAAQFSEAQVRATRLGQSSCWSPTELRLVVAVDQLCETGTLDSNLLAQFQSDWSNEQQLEILALVGTYSTISYVANVARLPSEPFGVNFPQKE